MKIRELFAAVGFDIDYDSLRKLSGELDAVKQLTHETFSGLSDIARGVRNIGLGLTAGLTAPIIGLGTVSAITAAQVEKTLTKFEVMLKDAHKAKSLFNDLLQFDRKTPFNFEQTLGYANYMVMMKTAPEEIAKKLMTYGEAAAGEAGAMGTLMQQLYQVYTKKKIDFQDIRPMSEAGIPIIDALQRVTGKAEVSGSTYDQVVAALELIASERKGLMSRQAETLGGLWSQLLGVLFSVKKEIGEIIVKQLRLKDVLSFMVKALEKFVDLIKNMPGWLKTVSVVLLGVLAALGPLLTILGQLGMAALGIKGLSMALGLLGISLKGVAASMWSFTLAALPWIALVAAVGLAIEDVYRWLRGDESVVGDLLGPWEDWKNNVKRIVGEVVDVVKALWDVMVNPFSGENWKNLLEQFMEVGRPYYSQDDLNKYMYVSSASPSQPNRNLTVENNITINATADASSQNLKVIRDAVSDSLMTEADLQRHLSNAFFGTGGS